MNVLDPLSTRAFLDRFNSFYDAVIRRIEYRFNVPEQRRATLIISTQDQQSDTGWSNVVIVIGKVSETAFREGNSTRQILSDGFHITWIDGFAWCDFSPYSSKIDSLDDLRKSDFYVAGESFAWQTEPYSEA